MDLKNIGMAILGLLILAAIAISLIGLRDDKATVETLQKAGYTDVIPTGLGSFDCGQGDYFRTRFEAINPQGVRMQGTVCCGLLKNAQ